MIHNIIPFFIQRRLGVLRFLLYLFMFLDGLSGYRLWNSLIASSQPFKLDSGSQDLSASSYPSQWTRYCRFPRWIRESKISSTSLWSSPSISIGCGASCLWLENVSFDLGSRSETWNTGWIFIVGGRCNLKATSLIFSLILNGPRFLLSNFLVGLLLLIFFRFKKTRSPGCKSGVGSLVLSACLL